VANEQSSSGVLPLRQAHLGHEDITTTLQLYARVRPERSADLVAKLDAHR
jgi:integrase